MKPYEHYQAAERLLEAAEQSFSTWVPLKQGQPDQAAVSRIAAAHVHAILATAVQSVALPEASVSLQDEGEAVTDYLPGRDA